MNTLSAIVRLPLMLLLLGLPVLAGVAQTAPVKVDPIVPATEKIPNVEVMLDNHFNTLRSSLYTDARGYSPMDPNSAWQYQVYQSDGKKYAIGWVVFQNNDSKNYITSLLFFKEKEPGRVSFAGGASGIDGKVQQVMFAKIVGGLPDPVAVVVGSQFVYVAKMESSPGVMNYEPGSSNKLAKVELFTNRIILTLQGASATSEKFFDWNDQSKSFAMNFTAKR